jgi:hypothetical protein
MGQTSREHDHRLQVSVVVHPPPSFMIIKS